MEYIIIIAALAPIIAALIIASHNEILFQRTKKSRAAEKPINIDVRSHKTEEEKISSQGFLFLKPWLICLLLLLCMAYVLPEVITSSELTRMAVYKIVIGIGLFFFILLQSSISRVADTIYKIKSADLELVKGFLTEMKK